MILVFLAMTHFSSFAFSCLEKEYSQCLLKFNQFNSKGEYKNSSMLMREICSNTYQINPCAKYGEIIVRKLNISEERASINDICNSSSKACFWIYFGINNNAETKRNRLKVKADLLKSARNYQRELLLNPTNRNKLMHRFVNSYVSY